MALCGWTAGTQSSVGAICGSLYCFQAGWWVDPFFPAKASIGSKGCSFNYWQVRFSCLKLTHIFCNSVLLSFLFYSSCFYSCSYSYFLFLFFIIFILITLLYILIMVLLSSLLLFLMLIMIPYSGISNE